MEGSRVDTQIRNGDIVPLHSLRLEVRVVHRLRDAERVRGLDRPHRLIRYVHSAAVVTQASVDEGQELAIIAESRDISTVTAPIRKMQA